MADNTTLPSGSGGDTIASDEILGVKYQRVKLIHGVDGQNDGDVAASNPLPVEAVGADAHDAPVVGNPVVAGGRANQNEPAAVGDGDAVYAWRDQQGRAVTVGNFPANVAADDTHGPKSVNATLIGVTAIVAAPGAGLSIYVTNIMLSNEGAAGVAVEMRDGATNRGKAFLAALGGSYNRDFSPPWKLTANTALNANLGAAGNVHLNVHYFVAP